LQRDLWKTAPRTHDSTHIAHHKPDQTQKQTTMVQVYASKNKTQHHHTGITHYTQYKFKTMYQPIQNKEKKAGLLRAYFLVFFS